MFNYFKTSPKPVQKVTIQNEVVKPYAAQFLPQQQEQLHYYNFELKLRDNFAEELLNLEMEVELPSLNMETITKLLELYREAVEYFESISSNKYVIFKNKIQILLTKKSVVQIMNYKIPDQAQKDKETQLEQQQKELQIRINFIKGQDQTPQVETFITEQTQTREKLNSMFKQDISGQSQVLQQRIQQRRNSSVKRDGGQAYVINNKDVHSNKETPQRRLQEDSPEKNISLNHMPVLRTTGGMQSYRNRNLKDLPLSERPQKGDEQK